MALVYFASLIFNVIAVFLPILALTIFLIVRTAKVEGQAFFGFLPYTLASSLGITGVLLFILAGQFPKSGVYALSPFSAVTQRPVMLLLVFGSVFAHVGAAYGHIPDKLRPLVRHAAVALGVSALLQCGAVLIAPECFYAFIHVPLHY